MQLGVVYDSQATLRRGGGLSQGVLPAGRNTQKHHHKQVESFLLFSTLICLYFPSDIMFITLGIISVRHSPFDITVLPNQRLCSFIQCNVLLTFLPIRRFIYQPFFSFDVLPVNVLACRSLFDFLSINQSSTCCCSRYSMCGHDIATNVLTVYNYVKILPYMNVILT